MIRNLPEGSLTPEIVNKLPESLRNNALVYANVRNRQLEPEFTSAELLPVIRFRPAASEENRIQKNHKLI